LFTQEGIPMRALSNTERSFIDRMPKAELHVHLEGSVYPSTLLELGAKHGRTFPFDDLDGARAWFQFRDFPHFIEIYVTICNVLLDAEDNARITFEMARRAAEQNIRYLEVTFAPASILKPRHAGVPDVVWPGVREGARKAREELGVEMQFILDPVRGRSEEEVMAMVRWTVDNLGDGLIGVGLGGMELGNPANRHEKAFRYAQAAGARLSLHAGETDGPHSIRDALNMGSERIGHGVTAIYDPELVAELAGSGMVLEVSPTSNICLGVFPTIAEHPFRALHDAGVQVTINSDDPPMFNTTLTNEYLTLAEQHDFTLDELSALSLRALDAAFLLAADKRRLRQEFEVELAALRAELAAE
jgi:adenosine deaminase